MSPRPPKFNFYLDENFPVASGKFLRSLGHHVIEGRQLGKSKSDFYHIDQAAKHNAVLVSLDRDFLVNDDLKRRVFVSHGALYIETTSANIGQLDRLLRKVLRQATQNSFNGKICIVSAHKLKYIKND